MKNVYKSSIVAVALCRKHTFDASLLMGRARQESNVIATVLAQLHVQ